MSQRRNPEVAAGTPGACGRGASAASCAALSSAISCRSSALDRSSAKSSNSINASPSETASPGWTCSASTRPPRRALTGASSVATATPVRSARAVAGGSGPTDPLQTPGAQPQAVPSRVRNTMRTPIGTLRQLRRHVDPALANPQFFPDGVDPSLDFLAHFDHLRPRPREALRFPLSGRVDAHLGAIVRQAAGVV